MESLGEILEKTRTERGLDLATIGRETNIAQRYLEALEKENFSIFPGEPYLLGFLRNYSEYLGLNSAKMVAMYRNLCIQESPVPVEALYPKKKFPLKFFIPIIALFIVVGILFALLSSDDNNEVKEPVKELVREPVEYKLEEGFLVERFYKGDKILFTHNGEIYRIAISATAPALMLETPVGIQSVQLGEVFSLDMNSDMSAELTVFVQDLVKNDEKKGAEVKFTVIAPVPVQAETVTTQPEADSVPVQSIATTRKQTAIFESGYAYPFTVNATFRGYCLFRYDSDKKNREQRYYHKSETLSVQSSNGIRLWMSNANAVKLSVIAGGRTQDLEVGHAGEVLVEDIKWIREEETNKFKLVVVIVD